MHPKKRFGQNFLTDKKLLEDLIKLIDISTEDKILEVGPGKGDFTENDLQQIKKIISIN